MCGGGQHVAAAGYDYLKPPPGIDSLADVFAALMLELQAFHLGDPSRARLRAPYDTTSAPVHAHGHEISSTYHQIIPCRAAFASRGLTERALLAALQGFS